MFPTYRDYESQTNEDGSRLKPWISLSGDDDGKHYLLYPQSEDKEDWNYDIETIIDTGDFFQMFLFAEGKSPEVPFHGITSRYNYFEFLRQFSKKQNMIKKNIS